MNTQHKINYVELNMIDPLLAEAAPVVEAHHVLRLGAHVGHDEADPREELAHVPLDLGYHPPGPVPRCGLVVEVVVEDPWFLWRPADGPCQEVLYLSLKVLVCGNPDCVEDAVILQALVDVRGGEGGVCSEVELLFRALVPVDDRFEHALPPVG